MSKIITSYIDESDYDYLTDNMYNVSKVVRNLVSGFVKRSKEKKRNE